MCGRKDMEEDGRMENRIKERTKRDREAEESEREIIFWRKKRVGEE